jgi:Pyruvate/2-oxoacid:ferredoxin oxidoreductase delta subunit
MNSKSQTKIIFTGEGGQGVQVMAKIFAQAMFKQKYKVCVLPHYGVEMRMGISMVYLTISEININYPKFEKADIVLAMTSRDLSKTKSFLQWGSQVINAMNLKSVLKENDLNSKFVNMLAIGILCKEIKKKLPIDTGLVKNEIKRELGNKKNLEENIDAFMVGINLDENRYKKNLNIYPRIDCRPIKSEDNDKVYFHLPSHCKGCGLCIVKCPVAALSWSKDKTNYFSNHIPQIDLKKCISCKICERLCPDMAIKVEKKKK